LSIIIYYDRWPLQSTFDIKNLRSIFLSARNIQAKRQITYTLTNKCKNDTVPGISGEGMRESWRVSEFKFDLFDTLL
jgi:hypothetical protein